MYKCIVQHSSQNSAGKVKCGNAAVTCGKDVIDISAPQHNCGVVSMDLYRHVVWFKYLMRIYGETKTFHTFMSSGNAEESYKKKKKYVSIGYFRYLMNCPDAVVYPYVL